MRAKEFAIEDITSELMRDFHSGYNQYCLENTLLISETVEGDEIQDFISAYSISPIIGKTYFFVTLLWMPSEGHKFLSVANIINDCILMGIEENGQLLLKDTVTGNIRKFPEVVGPVTDKTTCSVLFDTSKEKNEFLFMLKYRFSNWKIDEREK